MLIVIHLFLFRSFSDIPQRNCKKLLDKGFIESGLYKIQPMPTCFEFVVLCDMDLPGGGWTMVMRWITRELNFNQTWDTYASIFGCLGGNFFLGLEVGSNASHYKLTVSGYVYNSADSNTGDSLTEHSDHSFSTFCQDTSATCTE